MCAGSKTGGWCSRKPIGNMKRLLFLIAALLPLAAGAQERYRTLKLDPVNEADTLLVGWIDTRSAGAERGIALMNTYAELATKRAQYLAAQREAGLGESDEMSRALAEQDAMFEGMRKEYQQMLQQEGLDEESRKSLEEALADLDINKAESRRQMQEYLGGMAAEGRQAVADAGNPSEFSEERLLLIKRNLQKYLLGGRLWGFSAARDFRNGFAAVARKDRDGDEHWGFVNRAGRLAIPCQWDDVFNFNNQRYYSLSVWDAPEDEDDRPWTSVRKEHNVGMIDTLGVVRIPVRYPYSRRAQVVFYRTKRGELAAVRDPQTRKWGFIDRSAAWVIKPFLADEPEWDEEQACFVDAEGRPVARQ